MYYPQAYLTIWLIGFVYWIVRWSGNKRTTYRANPLPRLFVGLAIVALIVARSRLPFSWQKVIISHSEGVEAMGLTLCAAGVALAIWARRILGTNWSANPTIKEGHELIETGPYRLVRHPIYTGLLLAMVGTALGAGRMGDAVTLVCMFVIFFIKLKIEESLMCRQFPTAYPDYMSRTKALVPYVL